MGRCYPRQEAPGSWSVDLLVTVPLERRKENSHEMSRWDSKKLRETLRSHHQNEVVCPHPPVRYMGFDSYGYTV